MNVSCKKLKHVSNFPAFSLFDLSYNEAKEKAIRDIDNLMHLNITRTILLLYETLKTVL